MQEDAIRAGWVLGDPSLRKWGSPRASEGPTSLQLWIRRRVDTRRPRCQEESPASGHPPRSTHALLARPNWVADTPSVVGGWAKVASMGLGLAGQAEQVQRVIAGPASLASAPG